MTDRMWRLAEFRFDDSIGTAQVSIHLDGESTDAMPIAEAIAIAHERDRNLVAWWPSGHEGDVPTCIISKVTVPVRWEQAPVPDLRDALDERLWFTGFCGARDYLLGSGNTFRGRLSAWCPSKEVGYTVSLSEISEMSVESEYFVKGFLAGQVPRAPEDEDGSITDDDLYAWWAATERFRRTGSWYGRWGTCSVCGCVLLPDAAGDRCHEHVGHE